MGASLLRTPFCTAPKTDTVLKVLQVNIFVKSKKYLGAFSNLSLSLTWKNRLDIFPYLTNYPCIFKSFGKC